MISASRGAALRGADLSTPANSGSSPRFRSQPMGRFAERVLWRLDAPMPWRRKPARWLEYWQGPVNRDAGFTNVIVYCVGPEKGGPVCGHNAMLKLADLPRGPIGRQQAAQLFVVGLVNQDASDRVQRKINPTTILLHYR